MKRLCILLAEILMAFVQTASAADLYVATNGTGNGSSWANATNSIQGAIDAIDGTYTTNTVWVSNGVYQVGGVTNYPAGSLMTNRVAIWKAITVRSANNDPANTIIKGAWASDGNTNGVDAVRCVYMVSGASLIGFTLTNGATAASDSSVYPGRGGGLIGGTVSNCILSGCSASVMGGGAVHSLLYNCRLIGNSSDSGGGAYETILYNSTLTGNRAKNWGGGASGGTSRTNLYNCLLTGNSSGRGGGGTYGYTAHNCTIVSNSATEFGGGVSGGTPSFYNCIIYFNTAPTGPNWYEYPGWGMNLSFINCGTTPEKAGWASGNITNDPMFVDTNTANYRLSKNSLSINTGTNFSWMTDSADPRSKDLDGHGRVDRFSGRPDMGCYEHIPKGTMFKVR